MENISNDNVCVNYAFYNAMSFYDYYKLSPEEIADLYQLSPDFRAYLNGSFNKSNNHFFYLGCLLTQYYLTGRTNLNTVISEFVSHQHYLDCPIKDLLTLCLHGQHVVEMEQFCLALQQHFSRKNNINSQDFKTIEFLLDEFYQSAKVIIRFYKKRFLGLKAKFGRQHDDNDHGFLECLTDLIKQEQKSLRYLGLVASHLSDWIKETQNPVSKNLMADMAFEYLNRIVCHHPYLLKSRLYQYSDSDADYIVPLLNMLKFFEARQAHSFLVTIVETAEYALELRLECAFLLLDFFDQRHPLLASLMSRRFFSEAPEENVHFRCTRVGCVESFINAKLFSIEDLLLLYKKNPQDYQVFEALRHKISNDCFKSEAIEKFSEFIGIELDQLFTLVGGKEEVYNDFYFSKLVDLLFSNKDFYFTKTYQKMIDFLGFLHQSGFGANIKSAIVSLIYRHEFFVPEIYRVYLNDFGRFSLRMIDSHVSVEELCQRFMACGIIRNPPECDDVGGFLSGLDPQIYQDENKIIIPRKNFELHYIFDGFCRNFLGMKSEFFRYDDTLNVAAGVVLLTNKKMVVESWSEFVQYYTMGVNGQQYSCFMYHAHDYHQALAGVLLLLLKIYKPNLSLYYFTDDYGYYDYEFFGADELLFDQLIAELDFPCRKVKFFEPFHPTTEFLNIELELNQIMTDQGFQSKIRPDHFIDISKKMRGISRDQADWLVSMIPEMQAQASLPSEDIFAQALNVRNLFVALAREMIYDKRFANQLNGRKPLWTKEHAITQISKRYEQPSDWSLAMILNVFFDPDGLVSDFKCC
jgi:hypothetical protein